MGYTGGTTKNPTYRNLGDHTEAIQIDFDPSKIRYEDLLAMFWKGHSCTSRSWSVQYKNAVFAASPAQKKAALASATALSQKLGKTVHTEILPLDRFYRAEDYHQKYYLRRSPEITEELLRQYPDQKAFTDSTAATRANGFIGGYGNREQRARDIPRLGLSERSEKQLLRSR